MVFLMHLNCDFKHFDVTNKQKIMKRVYMKNLASENKSRRWSHKRLQKNDEREKERRKKTLKYAHITIDFR